MAIILIIDDSAYMRSVIRGILKKDGHKLSEAEDGSKGLQLAAAEAPDCIILDLIMPGVDGMKILNVFHEKVPDIPIIVLTADIQESVHRQCLELGAVAFINKPPKEAELRNAVKKVLGLKGD